MNIDFKEFCDNCKQDYCFLIEMLSHDRKYNRRLIMQMKMVEILKLIESKGANTDIGWQKSLEIWIESGMAKKFSEIYDENMKLQEIKKLMFRE